MMWCVQCEVLNGREQCFHEDEFTREWCPPHVNSAFLTLAAGQWACAPVSMQCCDWLRDAVVVVWQHLFADVLCLDVRSSMIPAHTAPPRVNWVPIVCRGAHIKCRGASLTRQDVPSGPSSRRWTSMWCNRTRSHCASQWFVRSLLADCLRSQ